MSRASRLAAAALDAVAVAASLASLALLLAGAWRPVVDGAPRSISWLHALFAAGAAAAVRHAAVPSPSLLTRLRRAGEWLRARPGAAEAAGAVVLTRLPILAVGFFASLTFGQLPSSDQPPAARHTLRDLPARFDANWYAGIAAHGYDWQNRFDRQQNVAFFPALPLAMRAVGVFTGAYDRRVPFERRIVRFAWAGLLVSLAAFGLAAWYLGRVAQDLLGDARAGAAALLLAAYPFAAFYSAAYTESLFLLASVAAWWHLRRAEWLRAGAWALLAGLTRPNGFLLSIPLGLVALGVRDGARAAGSRSAPADRAGHDVPKTGRVWALAVAAMPAAGMLLFTTWLYAETHVWFAWARIQPAWGRVVGGSSFEGLSLAAGGLAAVAVDHPYQTLNALGLVFAFIMLGAVWTRVGPAWAAYVAATIGLPLAAGGLLSMGRLTSTLFPLFLALAAVLPGRAVPWVAVAFALLQGLVAGLFYTWRNLY